MEHVKFYQKLSSEEQQEFQQRMMKFLSQVYIEGIDIELEELDEVLIAASAVIPVFSFKKWKYHNLRSILLYPNNFNHDLEFNKNEEGRSIAGLVGTGKFNNKIILSRQALRHGFSNKTDKRNTAIHEFVHLIDKIDGATDGLPKVLMENQYAIPWLKLIHNKIEAINDDESDIRNYGGTSETEFFAVASEYFFERPKLLKKKHPELYEMLVQCFDQDFEN